MVERLFLAVPRGGLQFVIVVFPDHTHLLFRTCEATIRAVSYLPVPISCTFMYNDGSAGSSLFVYTKL